MAQFDTVYAQEVESYRPLPDGWYEVVVSSMDMKTTSRGDGNYLNIAFDIVDGQYTKRKVFENYNYANPNPEAVRIGHQNLTLLARALGFNGQVGEPIPNDTEWYINRSCQVKVGLDKKDPDRNRIVGYRPSEKGQVQSVSDVMQNQGMAQPSQAQMNQIGQGGSPFWKR